MLSIHTHTHIFILFSFFDMVETVLLSTYPPYPPREVR